MSTSSIKATNELQQRAHTQWLAFVKLKVSGFISSDDVANFAADFSVEVHEKLAHRWHDQLDKTIYEKERADKAQLENEELRLDLRRLAIDAAQREKELRFTIHQLTHPGTPTNCLCDCPGFFCLLHNRKADAQKIEMVPTAPSIPKEEAHKLMREYVAGDEKTK